MRLSKEQHLRVKAMELALQGHQTFHEQVFETAEKIYQFLAIKKTTTNAVVARDLVQITKQEQELN